MTPQEIAHYVNAQIVPIGLMAIMFSMGLSLTPKDFAELGRNPRAVFGGLAAQLILPPLLALGIAAAFGLPAAMAMGLFIVAIAPGGVTSNAITYAAKANVALAVALTSLSSFVTVFSIPLLIAWALNHWGLTGQVPQMSVPETMLKLFKLALAPVLVGMLFGALFRKLSDRLTVWLRPASTVVLVLIILVSVVSNGQLLWDNLVQAGVAVWLLNAVAMLVGLFIAGLMRLQPNDRLTVAIEVGVHNATLAYVIASQVLQKQEFAITSILYGCVMVLNAGLLVRWFRGRQKKAA